MSNLPCQTGRMKIKKRYQLPLVALIFQTTAIARFGPARLVRHLDGRHELIGGTAEHHAAAREWRSLFAPEVVFTSDSQSGTHAAKNEAFYSRRVGHSRAFFSA
jgi:hypothetical protein